MRMAVCTGDAQTLARCSWAVLAGEPCAAGILYVEGGWGVT